MRLTHGFKMDLSTVEGLWTLELSFSVVSAVSSLSHSSSRHIMLSAREYFEDDAEELDTPLVIECLMMVPLVTCIREGRRCTESM